ncbi:hypothetical protein DICVIV_13803 [Dictyocaulus viviparus]|uniref:Uncharacterized protein n=1 Tax=Dictyocaulus viviparus TaxID=29172 RepID=A0A0D8X6U3_DICVI|nr:hypothetical protein DICVIV_13803 [Dictyocaulus viviparus]
MLTYDMAQRPHHIGVRKAWLIWHSQKLEGSHNHWLWYKMKYMWYMVDLLMVGLNPVDVIL